jgi:hypothetical protein
MHINKNIEADNTHSSIRNSDINPDICDLGRSNRDINKNKIKNSQNIDTPTGGIQVWTMGRTPIIIPPVEGGTYVSTESALDSGTDGPPLEELKTSISDTIVTMLDEVRTDVLTEVPEVRTDVLTEVPEVRTEVLTEVPQSLAVPFISISTGDIIDTYNERKRDINQVNNINNVDSNMITEEDIDDIIINNAIIMDVPMVYMKEGDGT